MRKVCKCGKTWNVGNMIVNGLYVCPECEKLQMNRKYGKSVRVYPNVTLSMLAPSGQRYEMIY